MGEKTLNVMQDMLQEMIRQREETERIRKEEKEEAERRFIAAEKQRREERQEERDEAERKFIALEKQRQEELKAADKKFESLLQHVSTKNPEFNASALTSAPPSFSPFDSNSELWTDYYARFKTFLGAHSIPEVKQAQVFLTNQSSTVY